MKIINIIHQYFSQPFKQSLIQFINIPIPFPFPDCIMDNALAHGNGCHHASALYCWWERVYKNVKFKKIKLMLGGVIKVTLDVSCYYICWSFISPEFAISIYHSWLPRCAGEGQKIRISN